MDEVEKLIEIYRQLEKDCLMVTAGKKSAAELMVSHDVVPVVRCKDCIHWYKPEGVCLKIYSDGAVSPYAWQDRNPDDFCSYGERKDNG